MSEAPEFSRPVPLSAIHAAPADHEIAADEDERAALAARFGLRAVKALAAAVRLSRDGEEIAAEGRIEADIVQACVVTGEDVATHIAEPFVLLYRPEPAARPEEEVELSQDEIDILHHDGRAIDLGEAAAQTMALALDPFPRAPHADEAAREAGIVGEDEAGSFGALKALRDKLGRDG